LVVLTLAKRPPIRAPWSKTMSFIVYTIQLVPTPACVHSEPFEYYVGSTWNLQARLGQHRAGRMSKIKTKGYQLSSVSPGPSFSDRQAAETAERQTAEQLRRQGFRVWQA